MDNPETLGNKTLETLETYKDDDNQEWTIQLATLGNKTLDENKQNTTEKPIQMTAIKNGQSRNTGNIGK